MRETAVRFGEGGGLAGIVTEPATGSALAGLPAFVFLNAGVTHRVGPSRVTVAMARALAGLGFTTLRFDFSGIGDSSPRTDTLPLGESLIAEIRQAMDGLARSHGVEQFVLGGICSGATLSFLTAREDERVVGGLLINAQGHLHGTDPVLSDKLRAATVSRHSWRMTLKSSFRSKNWKKALSGQLDPLRILRMLFAAPLRLFSGSKDAAPDHWQGDEASAGHTRLDAGDELAALAARKVRLFHLYCEADEGLDYFRLVLGKRLDGLASSETARHEVLLGANHTFTMLWSQHRLVAAVCDWAAEFTVQAAAERTR